MPAPSAPSEVPTSPSQSNVPEPPSADVPDFSAPSMGQSLPQPQISSDYIQQIAEEVVEEKWDDLMSKVGDIRLWKDKIDNDITSIKQEIVRTLHIEHLLTPRTVHHHLQPLLPLLYQHLGVPGRDQQCASRTPRM